LLVIAIGNASFLENDGRVKRWLLPSRSNHRRIKDMLFGESYEHAMFLRDKAPGFLASNTPEQLDANAIHLGSMKQLPFSLPRCLSVTTPSWNPS